MSRKGKTDLRRAQASLTIQGQDIAFDELTITESVNALPYVTASLYVDKEVLVYSQNGGAKTDAKLELEEFTKEFERSLNHTYNIVEPVTGELRLIDNIGGGAEFSNANPGRILFEGGVSAPRYSLSGSQVKRSIRLLHPDIIMNSFDSSIYNVKEMHLYGGPSKALFTESITDIGLTDKVYRMFYDQVVVGDIRSITQTMGEKMENIVVSRHIINKYIFENIIAPILLKDGNVEHTKLFRWIEDPQFVDRMRFHQHLASLFFNFNNFLDALVQRFCPEYLLQYTPNINTNELSDILPSQVMGNVEGDAYIEIETELESVNFTASNQNHVFPIGSVVLTTNPTARWGEGSGAVESETQKVSVKGRWPKYTIENYPRYARQVISPAPAWAANMEYHSDLVDEHNDVEATADVEAAKAWLEAHEDIRLLQREGYRTFLDTWAGRIFNELQLAPSVATFTIPLNLKIRSGFCYRIIPVGDNGALSPILQGFVTNVRHTLSLKDQQEGVAVTVVQMSHAHVPGFDPNAVLKL